jgi:hypothetical protein
MDKKPFWWSLLLVLLGTLYLIPEAIFNSQLVSLVGRGTPTTEDLENLELFGRSISGIGVTLLLADFIKAKLLTSKFKSILILCSLFAVVFPTMFYGQKYLVETFIIEPSTAEERQQAVFSTALRDALAINAIKITDVTYNSKEMLLPENLTFLSLFGGLLYADGSLSDKLSDSKEKIIRKFIKKKAYGQFDVHYNDYGELYKELSGTYKEYAKGSEKYNDVIASIPQEEMEYWKQVENEINKGYPKYKKAQQAHIAKASGRAQEYGKKIYSYFEKKNKCIDRYKKSSQSKKRSKCVERYLITYRKEILKMGIGYIEPDYWLIVKDVSTTENLAGTIITGFLTGGLSLGVQAISAASGGDGGFKDKRYSYTSDPEHYRKRIIVHPKFSEMFTKQTGYKFFISNLQEFRNDNETQKKLRSKFSQKGLDLPKNWTINDRNSFSLSVGKKIRKEADKEWIIALNKHDMKMKPNLSWDVFQLNKDVQLKIKNHMGDLYIKNIKADWNKKNFKIYVLDPNIEKKTKFYLDAVNSSVSHFANGGKYEGYGKQALRSVIVPPISMFLSLFLICLTLSKLPSKYYALITYKKEKKPLNKYLVILNKFLMPILILVLPILFVTNIHTAQKESTVNFFLDKVEENANPVFAYAIRWTLHAQPILHPMGDNFEKYSQIYNKFGNYSHYLHDIDMNFESNGALSISDQRTKKLVLSNKVELKIIAPEGSKIQIMNIKPKYVDNIILSPKSYDVKVTLPSGVIKRKWYLLNAGYKEIKI